MSKSILVINTPENCASCCICNLNLMDMSKGGVHCQFNKKEYISWETAKKGKPDWCPLKEVPEKKLYSGVDGITGVTLEDRTDKAIHEAATLGWNACIEEILKERD